MMDRRSMLTGAVALAAMPAGLRGAQAAALPVPLPVPLGNRLGFDILRKGAKLGTHVVSFESEGDLLTVRVAVELTYRFAGIALYRYRHHAVERWRGDKVIGLETQTDDNGTPYQMSARREGGLLMVQAARGQRYAAPADALPATHWNRRELDGPWINTQDGRILRPKVAAQGVENIPAVGGAMLRARRFALTGDVQLDMFYDDRQGWAGLSFVKDGTPIRYERQG